MHRTTRRIVGGCVGPRATVGAHGVWHSLPAAYLDAVCHTDRLAAYTSVVFGGVHRLGGTQQIERFHATLSATIAQLVRQSRAFSRSMQHLATLIWLFIHQYNAAIP